MAITTLSGILSGLQPPIPFAKKDPGNIGANTSTLIDLWSYGGSPGAGAYDTTLNGVTLTGPSVAGQLKYTNPASGNTYLAKLQATWNTPNTIAPNGTTLIMLDRLWHNGGISNSINTAQSITTPTWPARDIAGSTNGDGVLIALTQSVTGGTTNNASISYTNSAGTSSRTGNLIFSAGTIPTSWYEFGLQAGDTGVQSVQSFTWGTAPNAGTWNLVAFRPICKTPLQISGFPYENDAVQSGMPRIFDNSVLFFVAGPGGGNIMNGVRGHLLLTQG